MQAPHKQYYIWHYLLTVLFSCFFIVCVIAISPIVMCNDIIFGKYKGWNYNYRIFAKVFEFAFFFIGIRNKQLYEYEHNTATKYVFVANHISFFDIPEMLIGIKQPVRILGKKGPDKIPIFGYYYRKSTVMVDRSSNESRVKSMQLLKHYLNKGISILVCPEGTFNMTTAPLKEMYDGAFRLAIETQTNIKPLLILDTYHTLHYSGFGIENSKSRMVYLQEVNVQGLSINDLPILKQNVYKILENGLIRYKAAWINPA